MIDAARRGPVKWTVVAVHTVSNRRSGMFAKRHQRAAVCIIEDIRRCGTQRRRQAPKGDDVRVVQVDQTTDSRTERSGDGVEGPARAGIHGSAGAVPSSAVRRRRRRDRWAAGRPGAGPEPVRRW